jgi:hypothetical protein
MHLLGSQGKFTAPLQCDIRKQQIHAAISQRDLFASSTNARPGLKETCAFAAVLKHTGRWVNGHQLAASESLSQPSGHLACAGTKVQHPFRLWSGYQLEKIQQPPGDLALQLSCLVIAIGGQAEASLYLNLVE